MRSPFGRDVVKELSTACRQQGLAFGTYHSVCDWHHPDFPLGSPGGGTRKPSPNLDRYETYLRNQMTELIRNYGPLLIMWFDVPQEFDRRRGQGLIDLARSLQPDIIVNNRSGAPGDYDTPEQQVGKFQMDRPWETCMTICQQWAWKPNDTMKSLPQCLQTLVLCAGGDGNLLFNVGPMPDGRIEPRQVERLRAMGAWLAKYGETIYGTRGGPWKPTKAAASTRRGNEVFVHILRWEGDTVTLPNLPKKIVASSLLTGGEVTVKQTAEGVSFTVPPANRAEIDTIVRLELDGPALDIAPLSLPTTIRARASNVFQNMEEYGAESAFDDDPHSRWATDGGTKTAWVARDFGQPKTFNGVRIREAYAGRVQRFELQSKDGDAWNTILTGTTLGDDFAVKFVARTAREVRLNILEATEGPTIWEVSFDEVR
jgi:alpha-L-fucosidase